jgi:hypothetical protein
VVILNWRQLTVEPDVCLQRHDLGLMNLGCAAGLPGSERIDHRFCARWLGSATDYVRRYTAAALPDLRRRPEEYRNSEGYAKVLCLVTALQKNLGVRYNPERIPEDARFEMEDRFLHGLIQGPGGTCATMPVLYVAIGRRLDYPMVLVTAKHHRFCRWDEPSGERFNIEATDKGLSVFPDEYYRMGRYEVNTAEESDVGLLRSLTPRQALADFIADRGLFWAEHGNWRQCTDSFLWAIVADCERPCLKASFEYWMRRWQHDLIRRAPPGFPAIRLLPGQRRYPPAVPQDAEAAVCRLEIVEDLLNDRELEMKWWWRLRVGDCGIGPLGVEAQARPEGGYEMRFHLPA